MTSLHDQSGTNSSDGSHHDCEAFREDLARYVDNELHGTNLQKFESHLDECTECVREIAVFRSLKGGLQEMGLKKPEVPGGSVWGSVNKRITRPSGWLFMVAGVVMYIAYAVYTFITSEITFEKAATGLIVIGLLVLLASVGYDRIRSYKTDPYKGVEK